MNLIRWDSIYLALGMGYDQEGLRVVPTLSAESPAPGGFTLIRSHATVASVSRGRGYRHLYSYPPSKSFQEEVCLVDHPWCFNLED